MIYRFRGDTNSYLEVGRIDGHPVIIVDDDIKDNWSNIATATLPTDPVEVKRLIDTILDVAGMQATEQDWMPEPR